MRALRLILPLLMLLAALLPGASRAWTASQLARQGDWVEICSAQGMRWVSLSTGEELAAQPAGQSCQACAQTLPALPPPPALDWTLPEAFEPVPAAFLQAPRLPAIWRHAWSRGPPAFSAA